MKRWTNLFASAALAAALALPAAFGQAAPQTKAADTKTADKKTTKKPATQTATDAEIADAKAKGLVWVNLGTGVYHKDGQFFGKTKSGKFMPEADAQKAGYRAAKEPGASKKKTADTKTKT